MSRLQSAKIYLRNNGAFGSSCDGCLDTGHTIAEDSGCFSVWDLDGKKILEAGTRAEAEKAITEDWRAAK